MLLNTQIIKTLAVILIFALPLRVLAQSSLFQQGSKDYFLLNRLEIKMQRDSGLNFSVLKPYNRKWWVGALDRVTDSASGITLSAVDQYNVQRARLNNREWKGRDSVLPVSKKAIFASFYQDPANFVGIDEPDFFLSVNPVLHLQAMRDEATDEMLYTNTRGVVVRSQISGKLGMQIFVTENQVKPPVHLRNRIEQFRAVPGAGLYKTFKETGYDYFDARGSLFYNAAKSLDFQFGYDKMFIGNGYRSLFWSDHGNSHLYLNANLRIWKLNYMSRIMELQPQYTRRTLGNDTLHTKKYAAVHYLTLNVPKWLTFGFFEGIVFGRPNRFEFHYLNPVMFLRVSELQVGSPDNAFIGFDAKANLGKRVQLYGQILLDEFFTTYIRQKDNWWGNKWALQGGLKYIDMLGVKNLDLQLETNWIRPFTYSHTDTLANYTHYNQPIAHPSGSNVREGIAILTCQPSPRWYLQAKGVFWLAGMDPLGRNYGNNIFKPSDTRSIDERVYYGVPDSRKNLHTSLWAAYELKENLFLEGTVTYRKMEGMPRNVQVSAGLRLNIHRQEHDY
ncbi:MAG: hypothetical protein RLZZ420_493 [Bacteroidota bacterium]|jgi:hypothetical protein